MRADEVAALTDHRAPLGYPMRLLSSARASRREHHERSGPQRCSDQSAGQKQLPDGIHLGAAERKP